MGCFWNEAARRVEPPRLDREDQDRQSEKLRIARHIVELLRDAQVSASLPIQIRSRPPFRP